MTRIAVVEWADGLLPGTETWSRIVNRINDLRPDILVTNEMPFGSWLPKTRDFSRRLAEDWVQVHEDGLDALAALNARTIVSSRPVMGPDVLANEAFILEDGTYRFLHQKHLFPAEPGWEEATWFEPFHPGFEPQQSGETSVGALLCTELMFTRYAKLLGQRGAQLIASPRATGSNSVLWHAAGIMAAVSAGAYVVSSNRVSSMARSGMFGGGGFAIDPAGKLLAATSPVDPIVVIDIDESVANAAKAEYPAYVSEEFVAGLDPISDPAALP
ncbi:carbon-nitrogen hydrolase family protein [Rhizobium cauense]|uniref:carbon-nitrogen hydrolase family protein n=1 Tax=Rhizobium cauense TaxID=1166683 RepID=UPI001C6E2166|nr:carbon-nitrogen hydrolase family protein [Rhizobium cauense]MBW9116467.1 carbon-nitrogen hydrolase family protein [Rhizobium cauense]